MSKKAASTGISSQFAATPRRMVVSLSLDAVYFFSAKHFLETLGPFENAYIRYREKIDKGIRKLEQIEAKYADSELGAGYDEMEPYCIRLDRDFSSLEAEAYPFIRTIATIHFLCLACLEAHINIKAERLLTGYRFDEFDKLSISGKWLFYPKLVDAPPFDPGAKPFQSFRNLTKIRNSLVHYKEKSEEWRGYEVPEFVDSLGITKKDAERSLQTAKNMIIGLSKLESTKPPEWIGSKRWVRVFDLRSIES